MSLLRWNPKRDANEAAIVAALERSGVLVERLSGRGIADLVCYVGGRLYLLEIKQRHAKLTAAQQKMLSKGWPVKVARTPNQALCSVGLIQEGP